jgi:hypothetical protein
MFGSGSTDGGGKGGGTGSARQRIAFALLIPLLSATGYCAIHVADALDGITRIPVRVHQLLLDQDRAGREMSGLAAVDSITSRARIRCDELVRVVSTLSGSYADSVRQSCLISVTDMWWEAIEDKGLFNRFDSLNYPSLFPLANAFSLQLSAEKTALEWLRGALSHGEANRCLADVGARDSFMTSFAKFHENVSAVRGALERSREEFHKNELADSLRYSEIKSDADRGIARFTTYFTLVLVFLQLTIAAILYATGFEFSRAQKRRIIVP